MTTSSYSLVAALPSDFDETYRNDLVSAVLNNPVEESAGAGLKISERGVHSGIRIPVICCDCIRISPTPSVSFESNSVRLVAVFCPSSLIAAARDQTQPRHRRYDSEATEPPAHQQRPGVEWYDETATLSGILLSMIHPFLAQNFAIRAILTNQKHNFEKNPKGLGNQNAPGDIVILDLSHCPYETIVDELLEVTNCEVIRSGSEAILKILLLSKLEFDSSQTLRPHTPVATSTVDHRKWQASPIEIPACAVCLFRIDSTRLGLPRPPSHRLCSKFCCSPPTSVAEMNHDNVSCPRQRLLLPWPPPNHCEPCHTIRNYWMKYSDDTTTYNERDEVFCNLCGMQETLWVCLTCAFVGCGRYSNKHAAEHNDKTHHPFCLELSTLRIWSYVHSEFVHRMDLLECPASLQNLHQLASFVHGNVVSTPTRHFSSEIAFSSNSTNQAMVSHDYETNHVSNRNSRHPAFLSVPPDLDFHYERMVASSFASVDEKTPKKATMIGEEYEVLLQSALEDQAQYYEGEIAWLRATLSGTCDFSFCQYLLT